MTNKECIEYLSHLEGKDEEANQVLEYTIKALEENENLKNGIKIFIEVLKAKIDMYITLGMSNDAQLTEQTLKHIKMYLPDINID